MQFYNQEDSEYNTYNELFEHSTGFFSNTAVKEIIARGIPSEKIVVGKPATQNDAHNTGYVDLVQLGEWSIQAYNEFGWFAGIMIWQMNSDQNGSLI